MANACRGGRYCTCDIALAPLSPRDEAYRAWFEARGGHHHIVAAADPPGSPGASPPDPKYGMSPAKALSNRGAFQRFAGLDDAQLAAELHIAEHKHVALHPHTNCPYCASGPSAAGVGAEELVMWFLKEGWRESKQELVERLQKDFNITRKT